MENSLDTGAHPKLLVPPVFEKGATSLVTKTILTGVPRDSLQQFNRLAGCLP